LSNIPHPWAFWLKPNDGNRPERYAEYVERTDYLLKEMLDYLDPEDQILEPGCNCGRNLNALYKLGYKNLYGIDINGGALKEGRKLYPSLFANCTFYHASIEDWLKENELEFDVIFTLAVFEHIQRGSDWIFPEIAKIAKRVIITLEDELSTTSRHYPRNYAEIFTELGWNMVFDEVAPDDLLPRFTKRIFVR
jgi:SAM-dependent methyltransferase